MNKVEFSADTGAPRIIIQSNPIVGFVGRNLRGRVGHGLGGVQHWMDDLKYDSDRPWIPWKHFR